MEDTTTTSNSYSSDQSGWEMNENTLCLKVLFDQYMRRTTIAMQSTEAGPVWPSYEDVITRLRESFASDVPETFYTKYKDDEDDWIFFSTTPELHEAIQLSVKEWERSVPRKKAPVLRIKIEGRRNSFFFRQRVPSPQKPSVVESTSPRPCTNEKEVSMFMEIIETIKSRFGHLLKSKEKQMTAQKRKAMLATLVMDSTDTTPENTIHPDGEVLYDSEGESSDSSSSTQTKKERLQIELEEDSSSSACAIIKLEGSQASTSNSSSDYVVVDGSAYSSDTHSAPSLAAINDNNTYDNDDDNDNDGRWEIEVQILQEMGFDKSRREAMALLHKHDGNIQLVVKEFLNL